MTNRFKAIINPGVLTLTPYIPGKPITELERELGISHAIKLASNENALGPSPHAIKAAQNALEHIKRYPDGNAYLLKDQLSKHLNLPTNCLTIGNGSDQILRMLAQIFINPKIDAMLYSEYAFTSYSIIAHMTQAIPTVIPMQNWRHDVAAMLKAVTKHSKMIYIDNPCNPCGSFIRHDELEFLLSHLPENVIVVLDEAYYEYMRPYSHYPQSLSLRERFPNLVITRTFSKFYGLAGLRIGYSITHPDLTELLNRARLPFNVNSIAQEAALASLDDEHHHKQVLELMYRGRVQWQKALEDLPVEALPFCANFLTIDVKQDAHPIYEKLLHQGLIVRPLANYNMPNHLRITLGSEQENTLLISALSEVL